MSGVIEPGMYLAFVIAAYGLTGVGMGALLWFVLAERKSADRRLLREESEAGE